MWGTTNIVNIVTTVRCCGCQQLEPADWLALSMSNFHYTKPKAAICDVPWSLAIQQNDIWSGSFSMLKDVGVWRRCYLKVNLKATGGWMSTRIRKLTTGRHSWGAPAGTCRFWHSYRGCQHSSSSCWRTADEPVDGSMSLTLVLSMFPSESFRCPQCHQLSLTFIGRLAFIDYLILQVGNMAFQKWVASRRAQSSQQPSTLILAGAAIVFKPL